jgi:hypothetical protein
LRSQEANIKLGGQVALTKEAAAQRFDGTIDVERGTYRLDLGLVQRTFQVDSGTVTFYNDPQQAGTLNIWATYTVRQANQLSQDVRIVAHIGGTLLDPRLDLSSDERIALSYTEILSYLVFGQPSLLGSSDINNNNALRPVAQALLPSAGALIERAINSQIGFFDVVQVQTGSTGYNDAAANQSAATSFLSGSRIGLGKQIGERAFLTANAGLCSISNPSNTFTSSIGVTLEFRLGQQFSLQASSEPSTLSLLCRPGVTSIGVRPRQYGFDLFREWSF